MPEQEGSVPELWRPRVQGQGVHRVGFFTGHEGESASRLSPSLWWWLVNLGAPWPVNVSLQVLKSSPHGVLPVTCHLCPHLPSYKDTRHRGLRSAPKTPKLDGPCGSLTSREGHAPSEVLSGDVGWCVAWGRTQFGPCGTSPLVTVSAPHSASGWLLPSPLSCGSCLCSLAPLPVSWDPPANVKTAPLLSTRQFK